LTVTQICERNLNLNFTLSINSEFLKIGPRVSEFFFMLKKLEIITFRFFLTTKKVPALFLELASQGWHGKASSFGVATNVL